MLELADTPYAFFPPKPNRFVMWLLGHFNRFVRLPGRGHRITGVTVANPEALPAGGRILFLPNHSTHSDGEIMSEVQGQVGVRSCYMAAYDGFHRSRFNAWVMQRLGAFSVDREGSDSRALATGVQVLVGGRYALTIFPEGNVYLMNDRVTPFLEGAAYIGIKAQGEIPDAPIHALPVAIKATHVSDAREAVRARLGDVATRVGATVDPAADFHEEVKRIGVRALEQKLLEMHVPVPEPGDLPSLLKKSAEPIIARLEQTMKLRVQPNAELTDRIRKIRQSIHRMRTDADRKPEHAAGARWADEAILALRILSYAGNYLDERPTLDRTGETVEKLLEDLTSRLLPRYGARHAFVRFGDPIDLRPYASAKGRKVRKAVHEVTQAVQRGVQEGLDAINAANPHPGGEPF